MGTGGSFPCIKGLRHEHNLSLSSSRNEWSYTSPPLICPASMHEDGFSFMICWISHYPVHVEKIQFLRGKYLFSVLYYVRYLSCGKHFFIYLYLSNELLCSW
jgi:hypothetical protein